MTNCTGNVAKMTHYSEVSSKKKKLQYIADATYTFVIVAFVKNIGTTVCEQS